MKYSILFLFLAIGASAGTRGTVGNGGDVLVCDNNGTLTYEILDANEGRDHYGLSYDYPQKATWHEIVAEIIDLRLKKHSPSRAQLYKRNLETFVAPSETDFVIDKKLNDVPDSNHISIPQNCDLRQIAIQRSDKELMWGGKRYTIDKNLWDKLDERQKAVLVLHEIILREAIVANHENSIPTRYLNSYLFSKIHRETSVDSVYRELERVFPGTIANELKNLPFGSQYLKERVVFVLDKSGSNSQTDPGSDLRRRVFMNLYKRYFNTDYSQSLIQFNDHAIHSGWMTDKFNFFDAYGVALKQVDSGGSNLAGAIKALETDVLSLKGATFERLNVVFMIDGNPTTGNTKVFDSFQGLIAESKDLPVKYSFVQYGQTVDDLDLVAKALDAKMYNARTLGDIEF